jgi:hypothetical protein
MGKQEAYCGEQKSCEHSEVHEISRRIGQSVSWRFAATQSATGIGDLY